MPRTVSKRASSKVAGVLQLGTLQQPSPLAVASGVDLALDQQGQSLVERQVQAVGLFLLLLQGVGEALQFERAQLGQGGVVEHGVWVQWIGWVHGGLWAGEVGRPHW